MRSVIPCLPFQCKWRNRTGYFLELSKVRPVGQALSQGEGQVCRQHRFFRSGWQNGHIPSRCQHRFFRSGRCQQRFFRSGRPSTPTGSVITCLPFQSTWRNRTGYFLELSRFHPVGRALSKGEGQVIMLPAPVLPERVAERSYLLSLPAPVFPERALSATFFP